MKFRLNQGAFYGAIKGASRTHKVAYIGVMTALAAVCNMFIEFKLADTQFSITLFFSALTGAIIGPVYGFVASFLGDLAGFLYNSGGYPYYPWIGIAMGTVSAISGLVMGFGGNSKGALATKIAVVCALTFAIATVGINTTAFWITYNQMKVPYMAYLSTRLFVQGQIWNSSFNYALLFASLPVIRRFSAKSDADGEK